VAIPTFNNVVMVVYSFAARWLQLQSKVREQHRGIGIDVRPDSFPTVLVVVFDARPRSRTRILSNCVRIVEAEKALAVFINEASTSKPVHAAVRETLRRVSQQT